jgi:hypothetical protein
MRTTPQLTTAKLCTAANVDMQLWRLCNAAQYLWCASKANIHATHLQHVFVASACALRVGSARHRSCLRLFPAHQAAVGALLQGGPDGCQCCSPPPRRSHCQRSRRRHHRRCRRRRRCRHRKRHCRHRKRHCSQRIAAEATAPKLCTPGASACTQQAHQL